MGVLMFVAMYVTEISFSLTKEVMVDDRLVTMQACCSSVQGVFGLPDERG